MVNVKPRRKTADTPVSRIKKGDDAPWKKGDPTKKIGLNTPIGEPLMLMLDYLIENKVIFSKASFIRDVVSRAAEEEVNRLRKVREAVRRLEDEERATTRRRK